MIQRQKEKTMEEKEQYSPENYRNLLKKAHIWDGTHNKYFCPNCKRYVPKKQAAAPCIICGNTNWQLKNPLVEKIIDTNALLQYMYETFQYCIKPFVEFDKLIWKNGCFFYKKSDNGQKIKEGTSPFLKDMEVWCVSSLGFETYSLSICVRWTNVFISDSKIIEATFLRYLTFESPDVVPFDNNYEKDDEFYFNMICEELFTNPQGQVTGLDFKAFDEYNREFKVHAPVNVCCEAMSLFNDVLIGSLDIKELLRGSLTYLCMALDDFSLIPGWWGCDDNEY